MLSFFLRIQGSYFQATAWIPLDSSWIPLDPLGSPWILLDPLGSPSDPLGSPWILLTQIPSPGSPWIPLDPPGSGGSKNQNPSLDPSNWIPLDPPGSPSLDASWIPLDPPLFLVRLPKNSNPGSFSRFVARLRGDPVVSKVQPPVDRFA